MKVLEVAFTCYAVSDMAKSRAFYESLLGLTPTMDHKTEHGHWVEYEIGPHTFTLGCAPGFEPNSQGASVAFEVEDFEAAVEQIKKQDVKIRMGPMETPVCHMVMVLDPDGSTITIHKRKA